MRGRRSPLSLSPSRLEGSLGDVRVTRLLEACRKHLVTGTLEVKISGREPGVIELRAGGVWSAAYGDLEDDRAVEALEALRDGTYSIRQRLPMFGGELADGARGEGDLAEVPVPTIMRHCEDNALSCTVTVVSGFDRGEIGYRAGEIAWVELNGERDEDAIVDIAHMETGRFRLSSPPLELDIEGWPRATKEPTQPVSLGNRRAPDSAGGAGKPARADAAREAPARAQPAANPHRDEGGRAAGDAGSEPAAAPSRAVSLATIAAVALIAAAVAALWIVGVLGS